MRDLHDAQEIYITCIVYADIDIFSKSRYKRIRDRTRTHEPHKTPNKQCIQHASGFIHIDRETLPACRSGAAPAAGIELDGAHRSAQRHDTGRKDINTPKKRKHGRQAHRTPAAEIMQTIHGQDIIKAPGSVSRI